MKTRHLSLTEVADILSISKATLHKWEQSGKLVPTYNQETNKYEYSPEDLKQFQVYNNMINSKWDEEIQIKPNRVYNSIELFAGAGGLALGLEKAGFEAILLNEIEKDFCMTLKENREFWNVLEDDITNINFLDYHNKVDLLSGGFPCQTFSYAGNKLGFGDTRGTLFFEFARAIKEIQPKVFLAENVRGLLNHDKGRTLKTIKEVIQNLGYKLVDPKIMKSIFYQVPQKRERLFLIGIRNDLSSGIDFYWPSPYWRIMTLRDALYAGELYDTDVPISEGQKYPQSKKEVMEKISPGGYWRDLPIDLQKEFMKKSFYLGGGKTGMARRLSLDEPSLTLTCAPAQKQTERCHPIETRPLTIREYARIQTFPDEWVFCGNTTSQYKQIGNAVPVNLSYAVGRSVVKLLNEIEQKQASKIASVMHL